MDAHPSAAILQENVNVLFVLKVVVKLHNVSVVEHPVQFNLFINLEKDVIKKSYWHLYLHAVGSQGLHVSKPLQEEGRATQVHKEIPERGVTGAQNTPFLFDEALLLGCEE